MSRGPSLVYVGQCYHLFLICLYVVGRADRLGKCLGSMGNSEGSSVGQFLRRNINGIEAIVGAVLRGPAVWGNALLEWAPRP